MEVRKRIILSEKFVLKQKLHFLTFRGVSKNQQKIGYVSDMCRKISNNYFIVREKDKTTEGFHFHAILAMLKHPAKGWFKKGCHIDLRPLSNCKTAIYRKPEPGQVPERVNEKDVHENLDDPEVHQALAEKRIEDCITKAFKKMKNWGHVCRVIDYMCKELPAMPCMYTEYIIKIRGKFTDIASLKTA